MSIITLPSATADPNVPLVGRVLMLNTEKQPRFQCGGFSVTRNNPIQTVPPFAQEGRLRTALEGGILFDVTDSNESLGKNKLVADIEAAIKAQRITGVKEGEEVGPRVICGTDSKGNSYFITPKDDADYERMMEEIRATGSLRIEKPKTEDSMPEGISPIYEEEL